MGLQENIAEAIIIAFDELGGNPFNAIDSALRQPSLEAWIDQETTKIALAGGAEMIIPGLHALTIPAGISFLIHKMATISWGIGALKGAYIVETPQHSDLRNILTLWANDSYFNSSLLEHVALSVDVVHYAVSTEGYARVQQLAQSPDVKQPVMRDTLKLLNHLADSLVGDEQLIRLLYVLSEGESADNTMAVARQRAQTQARPPRPESRLNSRMSSRLALRLATYISGRVPARLLVGFIPIAGAFVNAFLNAQSLQSIADTAIKYYDHALQVEQITPA